MQKEKEDPSPPEAGTGLLCQFPPAIQGGTSGWPRDRSRDRRVRPVPEGQGGSEDPLSAPIYARP